MVYIKVHDTYKDITEDVETRFDSSNHERDRLFHKVKNRKVIGLIKDKLGGKIMNNICQIKTKNLQLLNRDGGEDKKAKGKKNCVMKRKLKFEYCKNCIEAIQLDNEIDYL